MNKDFILKVDDTVNYLIEKGLKNYLNGYDMLHKVNKKFYEWKAQFGDMDFFIDNGQTKIVIIFDDEDWVVKIPLDMPDYCEIEEDNYIEAANRGLEEFFAPTEFMYSIQDVPVYLQQRVIVDRDLFDDSFFNYSKNFFKRELYDNEDEYYDAINKMVDDMDEIDRLRAVFGDNEELERFIEDFGINDLHSMNFGILNGRYVLSDFSGF